MRQPWPPPFAIHHCNGCLKTRKFFRTVGKESGAVLRCMVCGLEVGKTKVSKPKDDVNERGETWP